MPERLIETKHIKVPEIWEKRGLPAINQALLTAIEERAARLGRTYRLIVEVDHNGRTYYKIVDGSRLAFETGVIIIHDPRSKTPHYELIEVQVQHARVAKITPLQHEPGLCHIDNCAGTTYGRKEVVAIESLPASSIFRSAISNIVR